MSTLGRIHMKTLLMKIVSSLYQSKLLVKTLTYMQWIKKNLPRYKKIKGCGIMLEGTQSIIQNQKKIDTKAILGT